MLAAFTVVNLMISEVNTLKKSQIIENIPFRYCAQVLALLNVRSTPSFPQSKKEVLRLLNQKITREEAIYLHRQWKRGFSPIHTAGCLKKPDGVAASVLVSMDLRQKGFNVQTEVLLNGRQCDVVAFKSKSADEIWAIELKSPRDVWQRGINQCEEYAFWCDNPLLAVMGLTKDVLMSKAADSYVGIAHVGNTGNFEIVKEPTWEFQCTNQSFAIFTVCELKKIIQFIEGKCPKHNKLGLKSTCLMWQSVLSLEIRHALYNPHFLLYIHHFYSYIHEARLAPKLSNKGIFLRIFFS
jgi:hypothetical protein